MVSEREDPVAGHPRYQKIKDLNEGTFGFVQLGFDKKTNAQVGPMAGLYSIASQKKQQLACAVSNTGIHGHHAV